MRGQGTREGTTFDPRRAAQRLLRALRPSAPLYADYRHRADIYVAAHQERRAALRLGRGGETSVLLQFRRSLLFGKSYLIAWAEDHAAYDAAMPGFDAITSEVSVARNLAPLPIVVASILHRRNRSRGFPSAMEHEFVHLNQAILGTSIPSLEAEVLPDLLDAFFTVVRLEYEAYLIEMVRWRPRLESQLDRLAVDQLALLRAHTSAIEQILSRAASGSVTAGILREFLDLVPRRAMKRLKSTACRPALVRWFQERWSGDVAAAMRVIREKGVDPSHPSLRPVRDWLLARARRQN